MKHTNNRITRYKQKRIQELFLVGCAQPLAQRKKQEAAAKRARLEKLLLERLEARRAGI